MAELLVFAANTDRRGEVIAVKPDGWTWGRKEAPPTFEIIKLPVVDPRRLQDFLEPDLDEANDNAFLRRKKIKIIDIETAKLAELESSPPQREDALRAVAGDYDAVVVG